MKKLVIERGNKKYYLLGINKEGEEVFLEEASFDCNWYWGIGYVEIFDERRKHLISHSHFSSLFLGRNVPDSFREYFKETPLSDREMWDMLEIMKSLYSLREYSDLLHLGGANITNAKYKELIGNDEEYKRINEIIIPKLLEDLYSILTK